MLLTDYIDKDLKKLEEKNPKEYRQLTIQLAQLEASRDKYPAKSERQFLGVSTKYYRVLYKIEQDYIICLVLLKKQGRKIENRHYGLAETRYKEFCKKLKDWKKSSKE